MSGSENRGWLDSLSARGIRLGTGNMRRLTEVLGNPQNSYKTVHVAGSDGKGSVCAMIYSVLRRSGMKTGMFSSPHILDICESISVDGSDISKEDFENLIGSVRPYVEKLQGEGVYCTPFEVLTAAAFVWFERRGVEYAVIEVGMGGSDDSTNVIVPEVSVITNICVEHTAFLGNDIKEIASKKAGIIKPGVPVATSSKGEALEVVSSRARDLGCRLEKISPAKIISIGSDGLEAEYLGKRYRTGLTGSYQAENLATAVTAVKLLNEPRVTEDCITKGLECASIKYRMQKVQNLPIVIDGSHTVSGMRYLCEDVPKIYGKVVTVFGVLSDKNINEISGMVAGISDEVIVAAPDSERSADAEYVYEIMKKHTGSVIVAGSVSEAMDLATAKADGRTILVTGSFRMAEGALRWMETGSAKYSI